jgi:CRISPR-associated protein Cas1
MGDLKRKDNSLVFRKDGKNNYLPIEGIKELYIMNEVSINTKLLSFLSSNSVVVHFFNYYGYYAGSFYPKEKYLSGKVKVKQVELLLSNREKLAKSFVEGIRNNAYELILKRKKEDNLIASESLKSLKYSVPKMLSDAEGIKEILAVEGFVWNNLYNCLNTFVKNDFVMNKRVKRPPDNPINAMISYGNSLLYAKTITQIYHTHLDQTISYLHEPSDSRYSLSLDISEVFKINIVLPVIINMINKNMIIVERHFERKLNYCLLNEEGRKKFTIELEKKLDSTFMHSKLNRKVSYLTAIKLDGYKLIKNILEDKPFKPFSKKELC